MKKENITPAKQFIIDRIREFPSLYHNAYDVIAQCVIGTSGSPEWNSEGLIVSTDLHYDNESKKWVNYPKVISFDVADDMYLQYFGKIISVGDNLRGPINDIPDNADSSWLAEISSFLSHFRYYTPEVIQRISEMRTFLHYNMYENKLAGLPDRYINNYTNFMKKVPSWQAKIKEIQYLQYYGKVDPATFTGMYI